MLKRVISLYSLALVEVKTVRIFFDHIWDQIYLEGLNLSLSESGYSTSVSEYSNHIFIILISNYILSGIADTIRIQIPI